MKKQKWLAVLLCFVMAVTLVACGREEAPQVEQAVMELPWGLQFGQTSEEFINVVAENETDKKMYGWSFEPDRKDEDGYYTFAYSSPPSWGFLCSETTATIMKDVENSAFPKLSASSKGFYFNDNKELYKTTCILTGVINDKGEKLSELFFPEVIAHCNEVFGKKPYVKRYSNAESLLWENDELKVEVNWEEMSADNFVIYMEVYSKTYGIE